MRPCRNACQAEHRLHVRGIGGDHRSELFFPVVGLIGKPKATLPGVQEDPVGVTRIRRRVDVEETANIGTEQPPCKRHKFFHSVGGEYLCKALADRLKALRLNGGLVHEAVVEVPDFPFDPAGGPALGCGFFDNVADSNFRTVPEGGERALERPVIGNFGGFQPCAVDMLVKVILRPDRVINGGQVDPRNGH